MPRKCSPHRISVLQIGEDRIEYCRRCYEVCSSSSTSELQSTGSVTRRPATTKLDDALSELIDSLVIGTNPEEKFCGADIPANAKMTVDFVGPRKEDYLVAVRELGSRLPAISIPILRTCKYKTAKPTSTVALLQQAQNDPLVVAVSGWSRRFQSPYEIDNIDWTPEVFKLCRLIGHELPKDFRDQGNNGQYYACHAEKQLAAFVHGRNAKAKSVVVHCSNKPCDDCVRFLICLKKETGLKVKVFVDGQRVGLR